MLHVLVNEVENYFTKIGFVDSKWSSLNVQFASTRPVDFAAGKNALNDRGRLSRVRPKGARKPRPPHHSHGNYEMYAKETA